MSTALLTKRKHTGKPSTQPATTSVQTAWREIADALEGAAMTDEENCSSGDSIRLLHRAAQAAAEVADDAKNHGDPDAVESLAFDVEALAIAALRVVGDVPSQERIELLHKAAIMMLSTCGEGAQLQDAILQSQRAQAPTPKAVAVFGWDSEGERFSDDDAVVVNPNASAESLVNWSLGQYRQLYQLQKVIASSGDNELVIEPARLMQALNHFGQQALAVLEVAMYKVSEQAKELRK